MVESENRKRVAVMCSANDVPKRYSGPAIKFASLLPANGYDLVWGASDTGLMKQVATAVQGEGGKIIGISMKGLDHLARKNADKIEIAENLGERKARMLELADAVVILVGGIGTIDETTDMLEHKKHGRHNKFMIVLNTDGFYDGFKTQLMKMQEEGFLTRPISEMITFAQTPQQAIEEINAILRKP